MTYNKKVDLKVKLTRKSAPIHQKKSHDCADSVVLKNYEGKDATDGTLTWDDNTPKNLH